MQPEQRNTFSNKNRDTNDNSYVASGGRNGSLPHNVYEVMDYEPQSNFSNEEQNRQSSASANASTSKPINHRPSNKSIVREVSDDDDDATNQPRSANPPWTLINSTDDDRSGLRSEATGFAPTCAPDIDADAAYALQLQQEEYNRGPSRAAGLEFYTIDDDDEGENHHRRRHHRDSPLCIPPQWLGNDETVAQYFQRQEHLRRPQYRHRHGPVPPPVPLQATGESRRAAAATSSQSSENDQPEVIPVPPNMRFYRAVAPWDDEDGDDERLFFAEPHPLLHILAPTGRYGGMGFPFFDPYRRRHHRSGSLQDTEDDFGPEDYERLLQLDDTIPKKKLTKQQINAIKTEKFTIAANKSEEENQCGICLEPFEVNQTLRRYPCSHLYHQGCSDRWLNENNACPICRKPPVDVATTTRSHSRPRRGGGGDHQDRSSNHRSSHNRGSSSRHPTSTHKGPKSQRQS